MDCSMPGFPLHHQFPSLFKPMSIELVMPSSDLILCCPLLLQPSMFPSIRVFSNESALHIRWPKYWSFNFSISPPNEYTSSVQFSSVAHSCPTLCNPMNCSMPGLPVHHQPPEFTQTHVSAIGIHMSPPSWTSILPLTPSDTPLVCHKALD